MYCWRSVIISASVIVIVLVTSIIVFYWSKDTCPLGTYACLTEGKCVPQRNVCNNHYDCPDGDDEDSELCTDLNGSRKMVDILFNRTYYLSLQMSDKYNNCDIALYPANCLCKYSTQIYCREDNLMSIPQNISDSVTHLFLGKNHISELQRDAFVNYDLFVIRLDGNQMKYLAPFVFYEQKNLTKLLLMDNDLTIIEKNVLSGLHSLIWLFLDNNKLREIYFADFEDLVSLEWINVSYNKLTLEFEKFPPMPSLMELFIDENEIEIIRNETFYELTNIEYLSLKKNKITCIEDGAFSTLRNLKELDLSGNLLSTLPSNVFNSLISLSRMYLGKNPFKCLPADIFKELDHLRSLNMEDIEIDNIDVNMFSHLTSLESIYFKTYYYCSYAPKVPRCRPLTDGISSMHQLLMKPIFRYATWVICVTTCAGNGLVLWGRFVFRDENKVLSLVIRNLAVSDFLMGIYLLVIAIQDHKYRDIYNLVAHTWISSWSCTIIGIVAMVSSEVSVLLLVFMSIDRFLLIAIPFGRYSSLNVKETVIILMTIWFIGIGIAVIPVLELLTSTRFYGINGLCFPLHIDEPYLVGWQISALIFFGINATSLFLIGIVYAGMFISIWRTRHATSLPMKDFEFAVRFFFIVLTDASCWLPIISIKASAYIGIQISPDLYGWLVVFVLPINSALNPLLYTFTTPKYRAQIYKVGVPQLVKEKTSINFTRRPSPQSTADTGSFPLTGRSGQTSSVKMFVKTS